MWQFRLMKMLASLLGTHTIYRDDHMFLHTVKWRGDTYIVEFQNYNNNIHILLSYKLLD